MKKIYLLFAMMCTMGSVAFGSSDEVVQSQSYFNIILSMIEIPFLAIAVVFSFITSEKLKGGKFGTGMKYLAWGFLVMAVGHLHMQMDHLFGFNLFNSLLGDILGKTAWFAALIVTWGLSSFGFYNIYKASKL